MEPLVCAVDVGTGSARAGIFTRDGLSLARAERPILINRTGGAGGEAEHDSDDIWQAVCDAVRAALGGSGATPQAVAGIAFDATCSLVVRDRSGGPVTVSASGKDRWDTIVWMDHRALAEADECTATGHRVLDYAGGRMSPEMQVPKLMWLKRRMPASWGRAGLLFDLADFLAWKACGSLSRSQCTLAAKWTFLAHEAPGWQRDFLESVGLADMIGRGALPERATPVGADLGPLTPEAAEALGLTTGTRVAAGLVDAHAGTLGLLGGLGDDGPGRHLALIAGTSSCVMAMGREPETFPGAWGPYWGAALPDRWLVEGGQSATGALLDHVIDICGRGLKPEPATHWRIAARINELRRETPDLSPRLHVLPDFNGNRSPLADPHALGAISGLTLDGSFDALCRLYWRTAVSLALGLRQILEAMGEADRGATLHATGGHARNPLLMQLYADAVGYPVAAPAPADDAVLLGTAMAAAAGAGLHPSLDAAARAMRRPTHPVAPDLSAKAAFERDYRVFLEMQRQRAVLDALAR